MSGDGYIHQLEQENEQLKATNNRLNRRCQVLESGISEKVKNSGGSMGRSLANAAAGMYKSENERLRDGLENIINYDTTFCDCAEDHRDGIIKVAKQLLQGNGS